MPADGQAPHTAARFARFCATVAEALGDLAALIITVNEPNIVALLGYENGVFPPAIAGMRRTYVETGWPLFPALPGRTRSGT